MQYLPLSLIIILLPWIHATAGASLEVPSIFGSNMVLQQGQPIKVWGWAGPGETISAEFSGTRAESISGKDGRWQVVLPAFPVSAEGRTLTIRSSGGVVRSFRDVLVGEVWILAGQSNMGWPLAKSEGGKEAAAEADYPWLSIFRQWPNQGASDEPARDVTGGQWVVCNPQQAAQLSGVGFFFARALRYALPPDTPIALINTQMGGTYAECWIDIQTLENTPSAKPFLDKAAREIKPGAPDPKGYWGPNHFRRPAGLFNGKVAPLQPFATRGVIWYQGEGNAQNWLAPGYAGTLTALIQSWRSGFEQPGLPFLVVQQLEVIFALDQAVLQKNSKPLAGFAWVDAGGKPQTALATVSGDDRVRMDAPPTAHATAYAWENWPEVSLFDTAGLPAAPFWIQLGE